MFRKGFLGNHIRMAETKPDINGKPSPDVNEKLKDSKL
jgi:hypothetical protein